MGPAPALSTVTVTPETQRGVAALATQSSLGELAGQNLIKIRRQLAVANNVKIYPFRLGTAFHDQSIVTYRLGMGTKAETAFGCYYVEADGKKIMVDTGPAGPEDAAAHKEVGPQVGPEDQSYIQLEKVTGVKPEEIDLILLTHLHWDHAYNLEKFPNAKIYVSQKELEFALNPLPPFFNSYENWQVGRVPFFLQAIPRMVQISMTATKITEHVSMIPAPGHTPGHMVIVVETKNGPYVLAGDAIIKQENMQPLPERKLPFRMTGLYMDFQAQWKTMETIMTIVDWDTSKVLGHHDPVALSKYVLPE
ncbi:MAG: N-acyl homoserine lactonase family protein [Thermincola sp.]|jgi:glyoxylase-like metal-dependent hydrolase (beta-lactamase superfamily II)|nr:N-acyl homoserine lactonase family protein [Thermincola sp.]MDT3704595.1 N-acyl homoserine lactonase family protein [Thermincola sp.]